MYNAGLLNKRIKVIRPVKTSDDYGQGKITWQMVGTVWANVKWTKGATALRAGELQAYDVVMIRCRYSEAIKRDCRFVVDTTHYKIDSFNSDKEEGVIQATCTEINAVTINHQPSASDEDNT